MVWVFDHILSIGVGSWKLVPPKKPWVAQNRHVSYDTVWADVFLGLVWLNRYLIKGTCYGKALHLQVKQGFSCKCSWKATCWCFQMASNVFIFDFASHSDARDDDFRWHSCYNLGVVQNMSKQTPLEKGRCSHTQMVGLSKSLPWFSILEYPRCIVWYLQPVCCIILTHRKQSYSPRMIDKTSLLQID